MKSFKIIALLSIVLSVTACSNTAQLTQENTISYPASAFEKSAFTPATNQTEKKSFASDHHLMMSLLNRPMTADQKMMLAFAKLNQDNSQSASFNNYVSIRGEKENKHQIKLITRYTKLIANDINAVNISGSL